MEHSSTMERTSTYIKADQFYYPHGFAAGGLNSLMASLENMWKAHQKATDSSTDL